MNKDELLKRYARLAVKTGINIQKGQKLVISSPIECASFARMIAETAFDEGAGDVIISWGDELFSKIRFMKAPDEAFLEMPEWQKLFFNSYAKEGAAFLSISASDPGLMREVNPERIAKSQKVRQLALKEYYERLMSNKNAWSIISIPTAGWATKVFPGLSEDEAVEKLWEAIFKIVRVDQEDPVSAWNEHKENLKKNMNFLNSHNFRYLHFKNSLGTDLRIELPENHLWVGGAEETAAGYDFIANMPTEEVFTMPLKTGVNGKVVSSLPLNYGGNLIENFSLTFKNGRIVDFSAEKGYDTLKHLIETDEGSHYLGEVALVPYDSPISNSGIIFFNTLYDENASCHLAIGRAYSLCLKNGENMSSEELEKAGANQSLAHVDFMIGTSDLDVTGTTYDSLEIPVFKNGNWAV
ncbi:peptidase M29 [Fervidicella metallireducens AeB]|uniref:Peptidase M29 n=1 Tax=Fervidicella metallireducens AeB TaxID=1403537 RepID=A0A017RSV3_9CLOT|nr:aminopeptidase [Fervidicella metallireducens]EYE87737.1 peptidase M29 [Fervidicella metallireducens AeB]